MSRRTRRLLAVMITGAAYLGLCPPASTHAAGQTCNAPVQYRLRAGPGAGHVVTSIYCASPHAVLDSYYNQINQRAYRQALAFVTNGGSMTRFPTAADLAAQYRGVTRVTVLSVGRVPYGITIPAAPSAFILSCVAVRLQEATTSGARVYGGWIVFWSFQPDFSHQGWRVDIMERSMPLNGTPHVPSAAACKANVTSG